jgi:hypothetical protein
MIWLGIATNGRLFRPCTATYSYITVSYMPGYLILLWNATPCYSDGTLFSDNYFIPLTCLVSLSFAFCRWLITFCRMYIETTCFILHRRASICKAWLTPKLLNCNAYLQTAKAHNCFGYQIPFHTYFKHENRCYYYPVKQRGFMFYVTWMLLKCCPFHGYISHRGNQGFPRSVLS